MLVLLTLAAGQFLMTLDSSVMNVSIATVAKDVGTTVTGIQGAITAYTLVMAALMLTGAKIGAIIGRKRAFAIGCVIYGCGSFTTSIAPSLPVLLFGWSFLEGVGAALIMPAIVALVAGNFPTERRPAAYGLVAAAGAVAVAVGPLIGGFCTTYFSWRWVFAGEVVVVLVILLLTRRIADAPVEERPKLDVVGSILSALGLGLVVFGVLRTGEWGWIQPKAGWAVVGRSLAHRVARPRRLARDLGLLPLGAPPRGEGRTSRSCGRACCVTGSSAAASTMFFFQFLVQAGSSSSCRSTSRSASASRRSRPARGCCRCPSRCSRPRSAYRGSSRTSRRGSIVRGGLLALLAGTVVLLAALDADAGPEIVFVPMLLIGLGIGALASQLGAVTVSAVPDEQSPEVGGVQNTMTNLGASLGTAIAGSILIGGGHDDLLVQHPAELRDPAAGEVAGAGRARRRRAVRLGCRPEGGARRGGRELEDEPGGARRVLRTRASTGCAARWRSLRS